MKKTLPENMSQTEIIADIQKTIKRFVIDSDYYEDFVNKGLLHCPPSMAEYYGQTVPQIKYLCNRALMSI